MKLEEKLKKLMISTYEKIGDKVISRGMDPITGDQIAEEIRNDTDIGIKYYKSMIALTIELLMRDKINIDERRDKKLKKLLKKRSEENS
jgi:hypothetical protein